MSPFLGLSITLGAKLKSAGSCQCEYVLKSREESEQNSTSSPSSKRGSTEHGPLHTAGLPGCQRHPEAFCAAQAGRVLPRGSCRNDDQSQTKSPSIPMSACQALPSKTGQGPVQPAATKPRWLYLESMHLCRNALLIHSILRHPTCPFLGTRKTLELPISARPPKKRSPPEKRSTKSPSSIQRKAGIVTFLFCCTRLRRCSRFADICARFALRFLLAPFEHFSDRLSWRTDQPDFGKNARSRKKCTFTIFW